MSKKSYRAPLTAAALTILLAACGGGEGTPGASQHSMDTSPAVKQAAAQANAQAAASASATAGGDANAAPAPAPAAGETPAAPAAADAPAAPDTPAATPETQAPSATQPAPGADAGTPAPPAPSTDPAKPTAPAAGEAPAAGATPPTAPAPTPATDATGQAATPPAPATGADATQPTAPQAPGTAPAAGAQPADGKPTNTATEAAAGVPPVTPAAVVTAPESVPTASPMAAPANLPSVGNNAADAAAPALDAAITPVAANVPASQSAPITSTGIRGDVLKTMLDQKGCDEPVMFTALDGERVPEEQYDIGSIRADVRIKPENYAVVQNPAYPMPSAPFFDATCRTTFYTFQPTAPGEHEVTVYSGYFRHAPPTPQEKRSLNAMSAEVPMQVNADGVTLGKSLKVSNAFDKGSPPLEITAPDGPTSEELTLTREADFSFKPQSHISYGVLAEWKDADKVMRMMLFPGKTEGEARLCWNSELSFVRRLQCKVWTAPQGWQDGQQLSYEGQYLVDDRSIYPGEQGLAFWKTPPMPADANTGAQAQAEAPAQ